MPIRTRLLILILSILVPAFLASVLAVLHIYDEQKQAQEEVITEAAKALAQAVDNALAAKEGVLKTLANSPTLIEGDLEKAYRYAKSLVPTKDSTIVLIDRQGQQLLNTRLPYGSPSLPKRASNLTELSERLGPDKTIVSDLYYAPVGKRQSFAIQVPIYQNNEIASYLAMGMYADHMQSLLTQQNFPEGWLGVIVDRKGNIIARTRDPEKFVGTRVNEGMYRDLMSKANGVHWGQSLEGTPTAGFFHHSPISGWRVIIGLPTATLYGPAKQAATIIGSFLLLLLATAVFAALQVARKTVKPIESLRESAMLLGKGEVVTPAATGIAEMDLVSSEMAKASVELHEARSRLEKRVAEAIASTEQAQRALLQAQKLEALGRLTGGIAHDFNNVLQTQTTALQLAHLASTEPKVQSLIAISEQAANRASALIKQLMSFGRVQEASIQMIDLRERIASIKQLLQGVLPSYIDFEVEVGDVVWLVKADPVQLDLAILNIVINARDAMPDKGYLSLKVQNEVVTASLKNLAPGNYVRIDIEDQGQGMTPEVLAKALDPFFTTKGVGQGTGLGLAQAYGFATQAGGTLMLHSTYGQGTTVTIYLPEARGDARPADSEKAIINNVSASGSVLFIDDDPLVREAVPQALTQAGFDVTVAKDGKEALSLLSSGKQFDVVFSDVVMPGGVSGLEIAETVKSHYRNTKVVLATGYSEYHISVEGIHLLEKPYEMAKAVQTLIRAINSRQQRQVN